MTRKPKVVIFLYNRLFDPLIQSNFWLYVRSYLEDDDNPLEFHVITFEDERFPLTGEQKMQVDSWRARGLCWTALSWHPGTGMKQKFLDIQAGFHVVAKLRLRGYRYIITLGSVAGTFAYLYARTLFMRLFLYQFEPHSEYAADNGMWDPKSPQYKISHALERLAARFATVTASGTRFMQERLENTWGAKGSFFKIPTVANDRKFVFDAALREQVRCELGISRDQKVLFYPGKFGGLYYRDETAWMFRWLLDHDETLHFLIVTPHPDEEVIGMFNKANVPRESYSICHCDYADIHRYYFAADFGIIAVPPGPSKKFISNVKVGEYLCAGLPFLITRGVSEDYLFALERKVGVVVDDFTKEEIDAAWPEIRDYLQREPGERRIHCRTEGLRYRGFETLNPRFRAAVSCLTGVA